MASFKASIRELQIKIGRSEELIEEFQERLREESLVCKGMLLEQNTVLGIVRDTLRGAKREKNHGSEPRKTLINTIMATLSNIIQNITQLMSALRSCELDFNNAKMSGETNERILSQLLQLCKNAMTSVELDTISKELEAVDSWIANATKTEPTVQHLENLWIRLKAKRPWDNEIQKLDAVLTSTQ